jgi:hypothetical protein
MRETGINAIKRQARLTVCKFGLGVSN